MRAIVIDDSRAMRMIVRRVLAGLDFECVEASDGRDALAKLEAMPVPALAVVDWNMPNMTGYEFVQHARKIAAFDAIRIVMVTTEVEMERVAAALAAGADDYLMKPFTADALADKVRTLIPCKVAS